MNTKIVDLYLKTATKNKNLKKEIGIIKAKVKKWKQYGHPVDYKEAIIEIYKDLENLDNT